MKRSNYIADGYNCPAFIKGVPLLYEDLRFTFRPMLADKRAALVASFENLKADAAERKAMDAVAGHIANWDLTNAKGEVVAVSGAACCRLPYMLWRRVYHIVLGNEASDVDPTWPDETKREADDYQFDAADRGGNTTVGEAREASQEKN